LTHAQFSYQYALCAPLLKGPFTVKHYSEDLLRDPELLRLTGLTKLCHDPSLPKEPSTIRVTIKKKDGNVLVRYKDSSTYDIYRDYPDREQLLSKFWDQVNAYGLLSKASAEKCIELVDHLEELQDIRELTELLSV
jgi:2-methylcitrate dehydratase PrpD